MGTKLQVSNKFPLPGKISDYYQPNSIKRRWEVMYDFKNKFYLTDEERDFFLAMIDKGNRFVQVGQLTLSSFFKTIIPLRSKAQVDKYIKNSKITSPWRENASS